MGLFDRKPRYPLSDSKKIEDELRFARMFAIKFNVDASKQCKDKAKRELAENAIALLMDIPEDRFPNQNGTLYIYLLCLVRGCELLKDDPHVDYETRKLAANYESRIRSSYTFNFDYNPEDVM